MEVEIIKQHHLYPIGVIIDLQKEKATYLINVGVAKEVVKKTKNK